MKKDQNIDQRFKNALSNPPSFNYEPEAWAVLQERLKKAGRKPQGVFLPGWAAALALFLLFGLFSFTSYLAVQLSSAGQRLSMVENQLSRRADTVWMVKNHFIKDKVNIHGWPLQAKQSAGNRARRFPLSQPGAFSYLGPNLDVIQQLSYAPLNARPFSVEPSAAEEVTAAPTPSNPDSRGIGPLLPLPPAGSPMLSALSPPPASLPAIVAQESKGASWIRRSAYQALQTGKPKGISLSGGVGLANLFDMPGNDFSAYAFRLNAELAYSAHWRLEGGLEVLHLSFQLEEEEYTDDYPSSTPETPSDKLQELYVNLDYLQVPLAVKYHPRQEGILQPYVKAGLVIRQARRQKLNYEFIGAGGAYYRPLSIRDGGLYLSSLRGGPGLSIAIAPNWGLYAEALYHYDFRLGEKDYTRLRYIGLSAGLTYHLY